MRPRLPLDWDDDEKSASSGNDDDDDDDQVVSASEDKKKRFKWTEINTPALIEVVFLCFPNHCCFCHFPFCNLFDFVGCALTGVVPCYC
jgi:biotin synthase-like enzyme